ncbi:MAG TPA: hypothetical protein VKU00_30910 [Chthonomonadaceae bacterium]|nr:hypothetical protein [Chthonomonadaceae bacterium]
MSPTNILVLIHGITLDTTPGDHTKPYHALLQGVSYVNPDLLRHFEPPLFVEWGHRPAHVAYSDLNDDQKIMDAENTLVLRMSHAEVTDRQHRSAQNHTLGLLTDISPHIVSTMTHQIKELELLGSADSFYYASEEGEKRVRAAVYRQILEALREHKGKADIRLHIIGHSLGVTVAHDFLFGLFAPEEQLTGRTPGYLSNEMATLLEREEYWFWRGEAHKSLSVGSMTSLGGQLPLMVMRKQRLVNLLAENRFLDPRKIGIPLQGQVKWRSFYDHNDVLGFASRRLYIEAPTIEEFEVDNGPNPLEVHNRYWTNKFVLAQIADLLYRNVRDVAPKPSQEACLSLRV